MNRLLAYLLILIPGLIWAQEGLLIENLSYGDLDTTSTPDPYTFLEAGGKLSGVTLLPSAAFVITREKIEQYNYRTLTEVLKDVPGFRVSIPGSSLDGELSSFAGMSGNYYLRILVDGVPILPSGAKSMPISGHLPIRQASQIEVVLGNSTSVFGLNSLIGVVNIITQDTNNDKRVDVDVQYHIGNNGFQEFNIHAKGKLGKDENVLNYSFFLNNSFGNTQTVTSSKYREIYDLGTYGIDPVKVATNLFYAGTYAEPDFNKLLASDELIGMNFKFKAFDFGINYLNRSNHSAIGMVPYYSSYQNSDTPISDRIFRVNAGFSRDWSDFGMDLRAYYIHYNLNTQSRRFEPDEPFPTQPLDLGPLEPPHKYYGGASDDLNFEWNGRFRLTNSLKMNVDAQYQFSSLLPINTNLTERFDMNNYRVFRSGFGSADNGYFNPNSADFGRGVLGADYESIEPFTFHDFSLSSHLSAQYEVWSWLLSLRYEKDSRYRGYLTALGALNYQLNDKMRMGFSAGRGKRIPSSYYTHASYAKPRLSEFYVPYPIKDLKAEGMDNVELDLQFSPIKKLVVDVVARYLHHYDQLIYTSYNGNLPELNYRPENFYGYMNSVGQSTDQMQFQLNLRTLRLFQKYDFRSKLFLTYNWLINEPEFNQPTILVSTGRQPKWLIQSINSFSPFRNAHLHLKMYYNSKFENIYYDLYGPEGNDGVSFPEYNPGAFTMDLGMGYDLNQNFAINFEISNLTGKDYAGIDSEYPPYSTLYVPQRLRWFQLGLKFNTN